MPTPGAAEVAQAKYGLHTWLSAALLYSATSDIVYAVHIVVVVQRPHHWSTIIISVRLFGVYVFRLRGYQLVLCMLAA